MPPLDATEDTSRDGMVFGTARSRLALVMQDPGTPENPTRATFSESTATLNRYRESAGVDNPWGKGLAAYEPNTVLFDEYENAYGQVQKAKQDDEMAKAMQSYTTVQAAPAPGAEGGKLPDMTGKVGSFIDSAMRAVGKPYVWGGTNLATGVDCSGLIYAAARSAGIDMKRYRAVDYGKMGAQVSAEQARPGDLVYWDNPNTDTDHVGIFIGNGRVLQAPQSGEQVKVSNVWGNPTYRRIFEDKDFALTSARPGSPGPTWVYGQNARIWSQPTNNTRRTGGAFA